MRYLAMADPKKASMLAGVLERERATTRPEPLVESDAEDVPAESVAPKGRGGSSASRARASAAAAVRKTKPRTLHLPDELFERLLVQSHRKGRTISDYVAALLDRHVPDHRTVVRSAAPAEDDAA